MGRGAIQAEGHRDKHAINIITPHSLFFLPLSGGAQEIRASLLFLDMLGAMMGYRALEEAVSILKKYGKEVARLLNQEREDPNVLRYQLYVLRRRACRRLERFMRWEYRRKYGWLPSGKELKKVKGELYISEMIRGNMERAGGHDRRDRERGGGEIT